MSDENTDPEKVALTPAEFASLFGKSQSWGYRQLYSGKVKALTGYGRVLIPASEVDRLLESSGRYLGSDIPANKVKPSPEAKNAAAKKPDNDAKTNWRQALQRRRSGLGEKEAGNHSNRSKALRESALRKLNRHRG